MTLDAATLYRLLPTVYRLRDDAAGKPLNALVELVARELGAIEENLDQLYDDQFIETCADWVAPYIGDLIGYRPLHGVAARVASPRAEVANTIAYRRRKGTALMLEQLAHDVTDFPARAVEFFEQLVTTQFMNHLRPQALATAAVGSERVMLPIDGPFNRVAHTADMRRPESAGGRYNIPNVGIFLWRLQPFGLTAVPLVPDPGDASGRRYRLNPPGADVRLFRPPRTEPDIDHLAAPINVPAPLTVREFALQVRDATATDAAVATSDDYGSSVVISRAGQDEPLRLAGAAPPDDPDVKRVVRIADLRDVFDGGGTFIGWAHEDDIDDHQIALDPERGRVLLGEDRVADHIAEPFTATFHYGFARAIGGGEYERTPADANVGAPELTAADGEALQPHLDALATTGGRLLIQDSLTYAQTPTFKVAADADGLKVVVGARSSARPLVAASGPLTADIGAHGTLVLDGLVIAGGAPGAGGRGQRAADAHPARLHPRAGAHLEDQRRRGLAGPAEPRHRASVHDGASRAVHHRTAARGGGIRRHRRARRLHRRRRVARRGRLRGRRGRYAGCGDHAARMHRDRQGPREAGPAGVELHLLCAPRGGRPADGGTGPRRTPAGGVHPIQLRAVGIDHAAPASVPAGRGSSGRRAAALHFAALRRPGLLPAARRNVDHHPAGRRRRRRDGRDARPVSTAARDESAHSPGRVLAFRSARRRVVRDLTTRTESNHGG
jgi:hypothetical protein